MIVKIITMNSKKKIMIIIMIIIITTIKTSKTKLINKNITIIFLRVLKTD